ncbi:MAG: urocanate hydratase, partial [Candidatus Fermentibacteria bacterium]
NGGGVGWGEVMNGGFGLLLDGSPEAAQRASEMLSWDVSNGLARRSWARNEGAIYAVKKAMEAEPDMKITIPVLADESLLEGLFE